MSFKMDPLGLLKMPKLSLRNLTNMCSKQGVGKTKPKNANL